MIYSYIGRPRNGKSYAALRRIVWTLIHTKRHIVTNMVIHLDDLQQYLDARGHDINVRARIRMLTEKEEMRHFWLYRVGYELERPGTYNDKTGEDVDYAPLFRDPRFYEGEPDCVTGLVNLRGTLFVIDEIHTLFPARGWQGTPRHAEFYCSQHAKLNDECVFITQNTKLVDPQFNRLSQEYVYWTNHRLRRVGKFRGDDKIVGKSYANPVTNPSEVTLNVEEFTLELELAACYDTSAGVGMPGGSTADKGHRAKGVPLRFVWAGVAVAVALGWWGVTWGVPYLVRGVVEPAVAGEGLGVSSGVTGDAVPVPAAKESRKNPVVRDVVPRALAGGVGDESSPVVRAGRVEVVGYVMRGRHINVLLSDGRTLTEDDGVLREVQRHKVVLRDGSEIFFRKAGPGRAGAAKVSAESQGAGAK